ncbi:MAG TPA: DUF1566 domain-containing protein [Polyangiaceae bacterium]
MKTLQVFRGTLAASAVLVLATLARADAPTDQYALFNLNSDIIQDQRTGLSWQRYPTATAVSFASAANVCQALSLDTLTTGWRVPSYKELLTLVDEAPHVEYEGAALVQKWIDGDAFPGAPVTLNGYWTSSAYPLTPGYAYSVNFNTGLAEAHSIGNAQYVRCVH